MELLVSEDVRLAEKALHRAFGEDNSGAEGQQSCTGKDGYEWSNGRNSSGVRTTGLSMVRASWMRCTLSLRPPPVPRT